MVDGAVLEQLSLADFSHAMYARKRSIAIFAVVLATSSEDNGWGNLCNIIFLAPS
jgi:hypothetical protein